MVAPPAERPSPCARHSRRLGSYAVTLGTLSAILIGQTATMAPLLPRVVAELVGPLELAEFAV